ITQEAITRQEELIIKLKELKRSTMLFLFTHGTKGEKTKMTEIGEIPNSWGTVELGKLIMKAQYGLSKKGNNTGTNPILRMTNQNDGYIALKKLQYVELSSSELEKFEIQSGDIIFNRTNSIDLVGRTAIYTHDQKGVVFASYLIRIRTDENKLLPDFFNFYMNTEATQRRLKDLATRGVSQSNISATRLTTLKIQLPTINEQRKITEALKEVDQKIAVTQEKLLSYQNLFRTLLHELMSGERRTS
ncbi:MAG: restriction endonuclease subunit S, partial [Candidatus Izemoplasmatales bacterium]